MNFRHATPEDVAKAYGKPLPCSLLRAWVAERDGDIYAVFGVRNSDVGPLAFSDLFKPMRPREILAGAKVMVEGMRGLTVIGMKDPKHNTTGMRHFGFKQISKEAFLWDGQQA